MLREKRISEGSELKIVTRVKLPEHLKDEKDVTLDKEVKKKVDEFVRTESGAIKTNIPKNARKMITNDKELSEALGYNEFTEEISFVRNVDKYDIKKGSYKDEYTDAISEMIEDRYQVAFKDDVFMRAIRQVAKKNKFNPVLDRINKVEWDGEARAATLFIDFLGAKDTDYIRQVTKKWLVGAVARAFKPGIKFELMPVLIGSQGLGKSTLCKALNPDYFLDNLPSLSGISKENLMLIRDSWIVEVAELSAMSKTAVEGTKAFISTATDKYRSPYARTEEKHDRKCVFIGTTNELEFLKDKTGNRRFLPVECGVTKAAKNVFKIEKDYILQVLAEAKALYEAGEELFLDEETSKELVEIQKNNFVSDPLEESINKYLAMGVPYNWEEYTMYQRHNYYVKYYGNTIKTDRNGKELHEDDLHAIDKVTTMEIIEAVLNVDGLNIMQASRGSYGKKINLIMNSLEDFTKSRIRREGRRVSGYARIETD